MKPHAIDWKEVRPGVEHSKQLQLYYYMNSVYDELSASHNGLIGPGFVLKEVLKCHSTIAKD